MAKAVSARQHGDTYQARAFWKEACRLFLPHSKVAEVGYEIGDIPHFDDVAVIYQAGVLDARGEPQDADYYQIKWHTDQSVSITSDSLTDPGFIGSRTSTLLHRLKVANDAASRLGQTARFNFLTTRTVDSNDPLARLVSGVDGELRLNVLFDGGETGRMSRLRNSWAEHLDVDMETLRHILGRLRLCTGSANLAQLSKDLSDRLEEVGLRPVEYGKRINPYDGLIMRLSAEGRSYFRKQDIKQICEAEGLWLGRDFSDDSIPVVGIRSFRRFTDHIEDETEHLLDLLHLFEGRYIRSRDDWNDVVAPGIRAFLNDSVVPTGDSRIYLDCHGSIAFAAGYELDLKSGVSAAPVQKTAAGKRIWRLNSPVSSMNSSGWQSSEIQVNPGKVESGVAFSVTHLVTEDVTAYAKEHLPQLGSLLNLTVKPEIGPMSVRDGPHAWGLAVDAVSAIRSWSGYRDREGPLHIFFAAPNGLVFFLGRLARGLGPIQLYEHDFDSGTYGAYRPSISLQT